MLRYFKGKFLFKSEALLEEFTWLHLKPLLNLEPIKRQLSINKGNRSDILGVTNLGQLALVELKKGGGKDSIDQLIRYRNSLMSERPQSSEFSSVDFNQGFLLVAVASHFSLTAIDYAKSKLPGVLLLTYEITKYSREDYYLTFNQLNTKKISRVKIDILENSLFDSLPSFIQGYLLGNGEKRKPILNIIQKILGYSSTMSFNILSGYYASGLIKSLEFAKYNQQGKILGNKICAALLYSPSENFPKGKLSLQVYLPTVDFNPRKPIAKRWTNGVAGIFVETDDFIHAHEVWDLNTKLCTPNSDWRLEYPLNTPEINERFSCFEDYYINYRKYMKSRKKLRPVTRADFATVEGMVQMALEDWSVR
ncbi:hypothetical protein [Microcoleus sp. N9_A1]|uniref:hypothetical protein n=1 Tax=Microcoleus sp. N9_A1 TaxID=3055380 RepID=UPI002FD3AB6C